MRERYETLNRIMLKMESKMEPTEAHDEAMRSARMLSGLFWVVFVAVAYLAFTLTAHAVLSYRNGIYQRGYEDGQADACEQESASLYIETEPQPERI
jgi:hypothetical protein